MDCPGQQKRGTRQAIKYRKKINAPDYDVCSLHGEAKKSSALWAMYWYMWGSCQKGGNLHTFTRITLIALGAG